MWEYYTGVSRIYRINVCFIVAGKIWWARTVRWSLFVVVGIDGDSFSISWYDLLLTICDSVVEFELIAKFFNCCILSLTPLNKKDKN
jgi:hypothetical protein